MSARPDEVGVPTEWREIELGEAIELKRGYDLPSRDRRDGPFPIVSSSGTSGRHAEFKARAPGVVIGRYGTLGEVHYVMEDYWPLNTALYVRDFKGNDPRFVSYFLRSLDFGAYSDKAAVPGLNRNDLHTARVLLPPHSEQCAIADILGTLDDKIELNRRMSETLGATAQALFKSWFVDFDPVHTKVEGRASGVPEQIADPFPDSFDDRERGRIPSGWNLKSIEELATIVGGATPSTKDMAYWDGGTHAWATPKDLSALEVPVLLETERRITDAGLAMIGSGLLPEGTVLLSSRAPIGYLAISEIPVAVNQGFIAMIPTAGTSNLFLLFWANSAHEEIVRRANGSTFLEISKANFRTIPVVCPPDKIMRAFDQVARPLYNRIVACARESRILAAQRDALLPKLLSGELRLKDAEKLAEVAVS